MIIKDLLFKYTIVLLSTFIFSVVVANATDEEYPVGGFEIDATVMELDLDNKFIMVAEQNILLKGNKKDGKMVWKTKFQTSSGNKFDPGKLEERDAVIVEGEKLLSGKMIAEVITLIDSDSGSIAKNSATVVENEEENVEEQVEKASEIYFEDGVWKN